MPFRRWLDPKSILLDFDLRQFDPPEDQPLTPHALKARIHEGVIDTLAQLFNNAPNKIRNWHQLRSELWYAYQGSVSTKAIAIGEGIGLPHVRTMQTKDELVVAFIRCSEGIDFSAYDGQKVQIFIGLVAPEFDDHCYRTMYPRIAKAFVEPIFRTKQRLLQARTEGDVIRILDECCYYHHIPRNDEEYGEENSEIYEDSEQADMSESKKTVKAGKNHK